MNTLTNIPTKVCIDLVNYSGTFEVPAGVSPLNIYAAREVAQLMAKMYPRIRQIRGGGLHFYISESRDDRWIVSEKEWGHWRYQFPRFSGTGGRVAVRHGA